jgi:hypothetical protein
VTTSVLDQPPAGPDDDSTVEGHHRLVRWASAVIAAVLLVVAALLVVRHQPPTRTPQRFCARLSDAKGITQVLASGDATQIADAVQRLDHAAAAAPKAIEPQVRVLVTYADGLAAAVRTGSDPDAALEAAVRRQAGQAAAVERAGNAVASYAKATCGITL